LRRVETRDTTQQELPTIESEKNIMSTEQIKSDAFPQHAERIIVAATAEIAGTIGFGIPAGWAPILPGESFSTSVSCATATADITATGSRFQLRGFAERAFEKGQELLLPESASEPSATARIIGFDIPAEGMDQCVAAFSL